MRRSRHGVSVTDFRKPTVAAKKSRKKKKIKFELTVGGLLGVGAVLFCIFLWMFLFGLWAGQTILLPAG